MRTLERRYSKTERIVAKAKFSPCVYLKTVLFAIIIAALYVVISEFGETIENFVMGLFKKEPHGYLTNNTILQWTLIGCGCAVLLVFILQTISLCCKELIITEDRIVYRRGILNIKSVVIPLVEIRITEIKQNFFQRIFGYGTVLVMSDAIQPYAIKNVSSPERFVKRIMKQATAARNASATKNLGVKLSAAPGNVR